MSKARGLADLGNAYSDGALSNRNLIINGAMQVAQRGTSVTGVGNGNSGFHTVDRVKLFNAGGDGGTYTISQSTDAPNGLPHSWKMETTTAQPSPAASHYSLLRFGLIEWHDTIGIGFGTLDAKPLTLSFWVKSSKTGSQDVMLTRHGNVQKHTGGTFTINAANTWEYKTISFVADTNTNALNTGEGLNTMDLSLDVFVTRGSTYVGSTMPTSTWTARDHAEKGNNSLMIGATSGATFQITGVQLEVGDTATPFEHRSYSDELQRCKRYYQEKNTSANALASGIWYSASQVIAYGKFDTTMRAAPTITVSSSNFARCYTRGTSRSTLDSSPCDNIGVNETRYNLTVGVSGTQGDGTHVQLNSSEAIYFDAEL